MLWIDELENVTESIVCQCLIVHEWTWKEMSGPILEKKEIQVFVEVFKCISQPSPFQG